MGLKKDWSITLQYALTDENIQFELRNDGYFHLLFISNTRIVLNLIPLANSFQPDELITLQEDYQLRQLQILHLWEDIWHTRPSQVLSRIYAILGLNKRVHGRSTTVERIEKEDAAAFLNKYHLQGSVGARYCFGLIYDHELIALAAFSNKRKMKLRGDNFNSAELIRFATKQGVTIVGGMSKLIRHYIHNYKPNDLMSYADRDWSLGNAYSSSGFKLIAVTPPIYMDVNLATLQRSRQLSSHTQPDPHSFVKIFNTGNLKYILDCQ